MKYIILLSIIILLLALGLLILYFKIIPIQKKKLEISERETKNELYNMYIRIDPESVQKNIDNLIDEKINEYVLYRIRTREAQHISSKDSENIVSTVTESIYIELSELYLFYIKLLVNIETDEDLLTYINSRVKYRSILFISENNKST